MTLAVRPIAALDTNLGQRNDRLRERRWTDDPVVSTQTPGERISALEERIRALEKRGKYELIALMVGGVGVIVAFVVGYPNFDEWLETRKGTFEQRVADACLSHYDRMNRLRPTGINGQEATEITQDTVERLRKIRDDDGVPHWAVLPYRNYVLTKEEVLDALEKDPENEKKLKNRRLKAWTTARRLRMAGGLGVCGQAEEYAEIE